MGKVDVFEIIIQNSNPIFFGGEILNGNVHIKISERLKINKLDLIVTGGACVRWTESRGSGKSRHTVTFSAIEYYINLNILLVGKKSNEDLYLEVGDFSYPFQIVLPPNLPTSFEHIFGIVRYSLQSNLDIPWAFDKHTIKSFTVLNHFDLNLNPALRQPSGATDMKVLCCGPCKSDPIIANFSITKTGFVPGETMIMNASVDNKSKRGIKMLVSLIQTFRFHATSKSKTVSREVCKINFSKKIKEKSIEYWNNIALAIPPVVSSSNGSCKLIEVFYSVVLKIDPSGPSSPMEIPIQIVIGTIPLNMHQSEQTIMPTYASSLFGKEDASSYQNNKVKGDMYQSDQNSYQPIYPYYKDFSASQAN